MATPSPFEVSRQISNNFGKTFRDINDTSAIDRILTQASSSGNPQEIQDSIGKILSQVSPERQQNALAFLQDRYKSIQGAGAAQRGGYDQYAPAGVQTQQVKNNFNNQAYNNIVGNSPQIKSPAQNNPTGETVAQQNQMQSPEGKVPQGVPLSERTDEQLVALAALPAYKPSVDAEMKRRQSNKDAVENRLKDTKEQRQDYASKGKYARQGIANKKQQIALLKTGAIDTPTKTYLASLLPGAIGNQLLSPETQVYKAGLFEEFGVLKSMFPGQIRVKEIELLEDKLATLDKSHEAKQKILENGVLKLEQDAILAKHATKIEKERPDAGIGEFDELVAESAQKDLGELYDRIIKGYNDIYIDYAKPKTNFVDQDGYEYLNVTKKELRKLLEETKAQGIELRPL